MARNKVHYQLAYRLGETLGADALAFFARRGIAPETLRPELVRSGPGQLAFLYSRAGEARNIKFRSLDQKRFWQVSGAEKLLYGLDDIEGAS